MAHPRMSMSSAAADTLMRALNTPKYKDTRDKVQCSTTRALISTSLPHLKTHARIMCEMIGNMVLIARGDETTHGRRRCWFEIGFKELSESGWDHGLGVRGDYGNKCYRSLLMVFMDLDNDLRRVLPELALFWPALMPRSRIDLETEHSLSMQGDLIEIYFGLVQGNLDWWPTMWCRHGGGIRLHAALNSPLLELRCQFAKFAHVHDWLEAILVSGTLHYRFGERTWQLHELTKLDRTSIVHAAWSKDRAALMRALYRHVQGLRPH